MEDLTEKLTNLLENPEILKNLSGLFGSSENNNEKSQSSENKACDDSPDFDFSPEIMQKIIKVMPIISSINKEDKYTKFLHTLKPLLSKKRQERLCGCAKIMKLIKIIPLLKDQDLF